MRYLKASALALALALLIAPVSITPARGDALPGHHGGEVRDAGPYHFELVAKPDALTLYLLDGGGKPADARGAKGTATVLTGKAKTTVELAPAGSNVLKGAGSFELTPATKVVVTVTFSGQTPLQARFTPLARAAR
jgi:hypothetical protein